MPRSIKKGPFIDLSVQKVLAKIASGANKPQAIKTWLWRRGNVKRAAEEQPTGALYLQDKGARPESL